MSYGGDTIRRGPEGLSDTDDPPIVFDVFADHDVQPFPVCFHVDPAMPATKLGVPGVVEWTHGNSLVYVPAEHAYYFLARFTDWLLKIDADTGVVLWELNGNAAPTGDFSNDALWSHPHLSDLWADGALVFDNGDHYDPPKSRVVQVSWDETAMTASVDRTIDRPGPGFTGAIGDARLLPDGSIVTAWGEIADVTIHGADGTLVWRAAFTPGVYAARIRYTEDLYVLSDDD